MDSSALAIYEDLVRENGIFQQVRFAASGNLYSFSCIKYISDNPARRRAPCSRGLPRENPTGEIFEHACKSCSQNVTKCHNNLGLACRRRIKKNGVPVGIGLVYDFMEVLNSHLNYFCNLRNGCFEEHLKLSKVLVPAGIKWHPLMIRIVLHIFMVSTAYDHFRNANVCHLPSYAPLTDSSLKEGREETMCQTFNKLIALSKAEISLSLYMDVMTLCEN